MKDWHEHRNELRRDMVFRTRQGDLVMLDRQVPGDGTQWYIADWCNGWSYYDGTIEPSDLAELLSENGTVPGAET